MSNWETVDFQKEIKAAKKMHRKAEEVRALERQVKAREWVDTELNKALQQMREGASSYISYREFGLSCKQRDRIISEFTSKNPTVAPFFDRETECSSIWIRFGREMVEESGWDRVRRMFNL